MVSWRAAGGTTVMGGSHSHIWAPSSLLVARTFLHCLHFFTDCFPRDVQTLSQILPCSLATQTSLHWSHIACILTSGNIWASKQKTAVLTRPKHGPCCTTTCDHIYKTLTQYGAATAGEDLYLCMYCIARQIN